MTIIDIKEKLLNKKWDITDLIFLLLFIVLACTFLTPILGVPIGIIVYLLLFLDDEDDITDEIETMNQQIDKKGLKKLTQLTKLLDGMAWVCVALLFSKYAIHWANLMFDWHLRWYFLENIPYLALILFILMFIFAIPSK